MTFTIITHVPHIISNNQYFAYAPYVLEMNIWSKYVNKLLIVAPISNHELSPIHIPYSHPNITFIEVANFDILSLKSLFRTVFQLPTICTSIYRAMQVADHVHLRCPGNMGLLGSLIQILFPSKPKTAKYAGNWDFNSKQPFTYKWQQKILRNVFLTRNMQVLVYGEWEGSTKNIKPFFTATYHESEKKAIVEKNLQSVIHFIFVGTLVSGKNPLYAIQLVENLKLVGYAVTLHLYGDGVLKSSLEAYIIKNKLQDFISLQGNQNKETLKYAYQQSHFVILPSDSEGWPKAVAEGMFWGCVPLATKVSCVPFMLDEGNRGVLLTRNLKDDINQMITLLNNEKIFQSKSLLAASWSQQYTLEVFEAEIKKLLQP